MNLLEFYVLKEIQNNIHNYGGINTLFKDTIVREAIRKYGSVDGFQIFGAYSLVNNYINLFSNYSYEQVMTHINDKLSTYVGNSLMEVCIE
jgi:hypothetical protein